MIKDYRKTKKELIKEINRLRRELSKIKNSQLKLKKSEEEFHRKIIEYEKLSALGRLTANVAHEIRNPIMVIGGFVDQLKKLIPKGTKENELLNLISFEAKRLEEILREVLVFSNKAIFKKEKYNINKIINESLNFYNSILKKKAIQVKKILNKVKFIYIDKKQVQEAINNIISNAIDAMPQGGKLTISTQNNHIKGKNFVSVKITDTGVGISEKNMLMIFEPFFTTKSNKKETGLGLPITKKIVEGHGGFININSVVGKGTTFILYFPYRAK